MIEIGGTYINTDTTPFPEAMAGCEMFIRDVDSESVVYCFMRRDGVTGEGVMAKEHAVANLVAAG